MTVEIAANCTACGACLATCPTRALVAAPRRPGVIDVRCTDCWLCLEVCPVDAISPVPPLALGVDAESWSSPGPTPRTRRAG